MNKLIWLFFLSHQHYDNTPKDFYLFKDSLHTEIISIDKKGYYECISRSDLPHTYTLYSQGRFTDKKGVYFFTPGIVDSLDIKVLEKGSSTEIYQHYRSVVRLRGDKSAISSMLYFNTDPYNKVTYENDIKLCIENDLGTKFYLRLDRETLDFGNIIVDGSSRFLYLTVGSYVVSKKYSIRSHRPTELDISIIKSDNLGDFCDFYLANHTFEIQQGILSDKITGKKYKQIFPKDENKMLQQILDQY